eukprot:TRINITY_DN277_c1_g1_i1.p1 TRINITY_DN277_c1_g1~~TRINITY_DN277_c1_g1_i1.p1  ORF type:complete len:732 (+),score=165.11 TRINITY_DN277_c1_g1_i1:186-2198(+)
MSVLSNAYAILDSLSKKRAELSGDRSQQNNNDNNGLNERVAYLEKLNLSLISMLPLLVKTQATNTPNEVDELLANSERVIRELVGEINRLQFTLDQLQGSNRGNTLNNSNSSSSLKPSTGSGKPLTSSTSQPNGNLPNGVPNGVSRVPVKRPAPQVEYPPGYTNRGRRFSVAGESFNPTSNDFKYERKVIQKSDDSRKRIRSIIKDNILFRSLEDEQIEEIIDEMAEYKLKPDEVVIRQGDDGDNFYVVESGELYVLYKDVVVATIGSGKSFGEIALMYNCPRTATVKAKTDAVCWGLGRNAFRRNLMVTAIRKRDLYKSFLEKVPLLESLLPYERSTIADALEPQTFMDGQNIIKQGEPGDYFYIIEKGKVVVLKSTAPNEPPLEVNRMSEGNYFGELALLTCKPRAATVQAVGTVRVLSLSRNDFAALMGPCEEILKRNMEQYNSLDIEARLKGDSDRNSPSIQVNPTNANSRNTSTPPYQLVTEFLEEEKQYLRALTTIVESYLIPIRRESDIGRVSLSPEEAATLFGNIEMLLNIHRTLSMELPTNFERDPRLVWGKILKKVSPGLKFYINYASTYRIAKQSIMDRLQGDEGFSSFLKLHSTNFNALQTLLHSPLLTIRRYITFLQDLQKGTPNPTVESGMKEITEAINTLSQIQREIDSIISGNK